MAGKTPVNPVSKKDLAVWRQKHFRELERTLKVAKKIRDDDTATARDRIEASKLVARLLHAVQPERVTQKPTEKQLKEKEELTDEEIAFVESVVKTPM